MISSFEVSQMMMAQNSMFSGQMGFAGRVGVGGGLHAYGSGRAPAPHSDLPHGVAPPPSFSYGGAGIAGQNYGIGNKVGAMSMSAIGAAGTAGTIAMGFAGMLPRIGGAIAPFVDPFSAFGVGRAAAAGLGLGMGGSIAAGLGLAGLSMVPMTIVGHGVHSFVQGGQQQALINSTLGQNFTFMNGNARTGQGFTRGDAHAIGEQIRHLSHIPEMMTSVQELTALIPRLKQSGVMTGVRDAAEFNRRFKEAVSTIKEVSKVLGSTMEEASEFFAHSRRVGFLGKTDQLKNAINVQTTSALTGMSNGQVMQLQATGADMATQIGARRSLGTRAVTNIAQSIGVALSSGALSESQILDVTGQEGEAGKAALAQSLAGKMMQIGLRTAAGRFLMAGAAKFEDGKYVGLDQNVVRALNHGTISVEDLRRRGQAAIASRVNKAAFKAREEDIAADFAGSIGPGGFAGFMEGISGRRFSELGEEGTTLLLKNYGFTAGEADIARTLFGVDTQGQQEQMRRLRSSEAAIKEKYSPEAIWRRMKTKIHHALFAGLESAAARAQTEIAETVDRAIDDLVDRHVLTLSKESSEAVAKAFSGNSRELRNMIVEASSGGQQGLLGQRRTTSFWGRVASGTTAALLTAADPFRVGGLALGGALSGRIDQAVTEFLDNRGESGRLREMAKLLGVDTSEGFLSAQKRLNEGVDLGNVDGGALRFARSVIQEALEGDEADGTTEGHRRRLDKVRKALSSRMHGSIFASREENEQAFMLRRTFEKLSRSKDLQGMDPMLALISAVQGEFEGRGDQIDFRKGLADVAGGGAYMSAAERKDALDRATKGLRKYVNTDTINLLRDDPRLRRVLVRGLTDATIGGPGGALSMETAELVQQELAKKGFSVSLEDAEKLKTANRQLQHARKKDGKGLFDSIEVFRQEHARAQRDVVTGEFRKAGVELTRALERIGDGGELGEEVSALSKDLFAFADGVTGENVDELMGNLRNRFADVAERLLDDKSWTEKQKDEVFSRSPGLRAAASKIQQTRSLVGRRFKSVEDLARRLGFSSDEDIATIRGSLGKDPIGSFRFTKEMMEKVSRAVAGTVGGRNIALQGASNAGGSGDPATDLTTTLQGIKKSIDLNTSVVAAAHHALIKKDKDLAAMVAGLKENAGPPPN